MDQHLDVTGIDMTSLVYVREGLESGGHCGGNFLIVAMSSRPSAAARSRPTPSIG